ncbi:MAG TPA: alpha/beta hydrolase [Stellaceae bacterium]|nr:alpha/beta hydrolase [Stellaceae bacterium]
MSSAEVDRLTVAGIELETLRRGQGATLLLLHGFETISPEARFLERLARRFAILAPSSPGFGNTARPEDVSEVYDLVRLYLELLEGLPDDRVSVVGFSFGGWLAAEMAVACCHRIRKLVLVDPLGIKVSDRETADILDIFNTHPRDVAPRRWRAPERWAPDFNAMSDDAIVRYARGREALSVYGWHPYMHNPALKRWLARIKVPTLVLWGAEDGIVSPSYGRAYSALIPGARFTAIENAGHHPEIEQPDAFVDHVLAFLET